MPNFSRTESISGATFIITYDENDPSREKVERRVSPELVQNLPGSELFGYGAVEIRLTKLLSRTR